MTVVVKRKGHKESFDERKVYGSVYAACLSAHYDEGTAESVAGAITEKVRGFVKGKKEISSREIHEKVAGELGKKSKELSFFYDQHLPDLRRL